MKRAVPRTLLVSLLVSGALCSFAIGQAAAQGQWKTLPYPMPINPVHVALMNNGTVLIVAGSGNLAACRLLVHLLRIAPMPDDRSLRAEP